MPRVPWLLLSVSTLLLAGCVRAANEASMIPPDPRTAVDDLLATDRAFSAASARTDLASGISAMLADDVAMPMAGRGMVMGAELVREALRASPDASSRASWAPIRGGVSADGQHGFTFGYMSLARRDGTTVPLKYLAYWVREAGGWRVAAYKRAPRAPGDVPTALLPPALPRAAVPIVRDAAIIERHRASIERAERDFSDTAQRIGLGPAFARFGSDDAVNLGGPNEAAFVVGAHAIAEVVGEGAPPPGSPVSWAPDRVIVASSGDLGVTIGTITPNAPAPGIPFFTVWRRESPEAEWRYVAE